MSSNTASLVGALSDASQLRQHHPSLSHSHMTSPVIAASTSSPRVMVRNGTAVPGVAAASGTRVNGSSTSGALLSPIPTPRGGGLPLLLAQESVSVMVRLRGASATPSLASASTAGPGTAAAAASSSSGAVAGAAPGLTSPRSSAHPAAAPAPPALVSYTVEEGTLKTPRTGRRVAAATAAAAMTTLGSGLTSPRSNANVAASGDAVVLSETSSPRSWVESPHQRPTPSSPRANSHIASSGANTAGAANSMDAASLATTANHNSINNASSSSPTISVMLPRALMAAGSPHASFTTMPTTTMNSSANAAATTSYTVPGSGGVSANNTAAPTHATIGSRGRILTIAPPNSDDRRQYEFGDVFEPDVSNAALCERLVPSVMEQLSAGYNVCVLCYGQTGSGKTYTMNAVAPAVAEEVFRTLELHNEVVEVSYIQIYNNKAYNLLDGPHAGKYGAELSRPPPPPPQAGGVGLGGGGLSAASEPKVLVRSAAELLSKLRNASRLRVTTAHAINARSSRSFTLLTLHITRFLEGTPLTTTRVTLADLAGTGRLKRSGATGESQDQAIFINKSLLALREMVESTNAETDILHFRDSLLTTYLAPRMRSWHLFLLVTVSLEVCNYEESKSSLEFATNARRRKIKKVRSRMADRLAGSVARLYYGSANGTHGHGNGTIAATGRDDAEVAELQGIVSVLQYRIRVLEESLKMEQQQRTALEVQRSPILSPLSGGRSSFMSDDDEEKGGSSSCSERHQRHSEAQVDRLRRECQFYRQLLRERAEDLRRMQQPSGVSPPAAGAAIAASAFTAMMNAAHTAGGGGGGPVPSLRSPLLLDSVTSPLSNSLEAAPLSPVSENSGGGGGGAGVEARVHATHRTPHSSLSNSVRSGAELLESTGFAAADITEDVFAQLAQCIAALQTHQASPLPNTTAAAESTVAEQSEGLEEGLPVDDAEATPEQRLHNAMLRAREQYEDVRERLLVVSSSLNGLRAQNHQLFDEVLRANRALVTHEEKAKAHHERLQREKVRASTAETAVEQLRLQLFQAYAEQPISEELTRLYLDERPTQHAAEALSGLQLAEHQEEVEKFKAHQRALQDKITELVTTVEQLTRASTQKDVSLATLESLITPAQRALFHTMSCQHSAGTNSSVAVNGSGGGGSAGNGGGAAEDSAERARSAAANGEDSAADCFSLLQSRVSELRALLAKERQQHQLTQCEVVEARDEARRSRQELRQAFLQQQEEGRRVAQLTAENYDLLQQNERQQLYLDQIHVSFQEQLLELRRYHVAETEEQRRAMEADFRGHHHSGKPRRSGPLVNESVEEEEDTDEEDEEGDMRGRGNTSTRRGTSQGGAVPAPPSARGEWPAATTTTTTAVATLNPVGGLREEEETTRGGGPVTADPSQGDFYVVSSTPLHSDRANFPSQRSSKTKTHSARRGQASTSKGSKGGASSSGAVALSGRRRTKGKPAAQPSTKSRSAPATTAAAGPFPPPALILRDERRVTAMLESVPPLTVPLNGRTAKGQR